MASNQPYDWLGPGIYFWESDPLRAAEWAHDRVSRKKAHEAYVIGAVIDLGNCLDLTQREYLEILKVMFDGVKDAHELAGKPIPQNKDAKGSAGSDKLLRFLDCEVIRFTHRAIDKGDVPGLLPFDTVRGAFFEGAEVYPGSGFLERTHTQISVLNHAYILGIFRPPGVGEIIQGTRAAG